MLKSKYWKLCSKVAENKSNSVQKLLQGWKIVIPIGIGLLVSGYLLYSNLYTPHFKKVAEGTGYYIWSGSGEVNLSDSTNFELVDHGNYILETASDVLGSLSWGGSTVLFLILAAIMMSMRDVGYVFRIRSLTDNQLSWRSAINTIIVWEFASSLTPGVVGGAGVAMFILNKEKIPLGRSTAIVFATAMMDNLYYLLAIPILYFFVGDTFFPNAHHLGNLHYLFYGAYGVVFLVFAALVTSLFIYPQFVKQLFRVIFSFPIIRRWKDKALVTGDDLVLASKELRQKPFWFWLKAFLFTAFSWTSRFMVANFIIQAFYGISLLEHITVFARELGMWLFMLVSPTPGGSGVAEYSFSLFLDDIIPFGVIGVLAVIWRFISYYPYLFIGSIVFPRWIRK